MVTDIILLACLISPLTGLLVWILIARRRGKELKRIKKVNSDLVRDLLKADVTREELWVQILMLKGVDFTLKGDLVVSVVAAMSSSTLWSLLKEAWAGIPIGCEPCPVVEEHGLFKVGVGWTIIVGQLTYSVGEVLPDFLWLKEKGKRLDAEKLGKEIYNDLISSGRGDAASEKSRTTLAEKPRR